MAYEESFAPEVETAPPPVAETPVAAPVAPLETPQVPEVAPTPAEAPEAAPVAPIEPAPTETPAVPAFNEADFLKQHLGDDAPATAVELAERYKALQAKQLTPEHESRLALLSDSAKLAEYADLARKDYDKAPPRQVMLERFVEQHPGMPPALLEEEFAEHFATKYPLMAQKLEDPTSIDDSDPLLLKEMQKAEYYSQADRAALKTAQQEKTQQFLASQAAAPQPQLTPAQAADAKALPLWLDEAFKEGATLPVELSDGTKLALPITNAADFKAAFNDTYARLDAHALNADKTINRPNQALITQFLQLGPQAFVQHIAKQVLAAQPAPAPAIPISELTNASGGRQPASPAPAAPSPPAVNTADWQKSNF
jgi:hypothetical protein